MDNSNHSLQQSENQTVVSKVQKSIILAFERTATDLVNIEFMTKDIVSEFPKMKEEEIVKAIRNGSLGLYGKTYKLSTQEICIWIREYLKDRNTKLGL